MKKNYIRRVKLELDVPRKKKKEIIRDLEEIFASAAEHGETEQDVIDRLGSAEEFADGMKEQLLDEKPKKIGFFTYLFALSAIIIMGVTLTVKLIQRNSQNVIGYATSMTGITIVGGMQFDFLNIALALMIIACIAAVIRTIYIMVVRLRK